MTYVTARGNVIVNVTLEVTLGELFTGSELMSQLHERATALAVSEVGKLIQRKPEDHAYQPASFRIIDTPKVSKIVMDVKE